MVARIGGSRAVIVAAVGAALILSLGTSAFVLATRAPAGAPSGPPEGFYADSPNSPETNQPGRVDYSGDEPANPAEDPATEDSDPGTAVEGEDDLGPLNMSDDAVAQRELAALHPDGLLPTLMNDDPLPEPVFAGSVREATDLLMPYFGSNVVTIGSGHVPSQPTTVETIKDQCLIDWAKTSLPAYNDKSFIGIETVCDRPAAVLVGGYGVSGRDLVGRAGDNDADAALREILFGKPVLHIGAAMTSDAGAVIVVVTAAP